jgi:SAM-dependent methyltransferase
MQETTDWRVRAHAHWIHRRRISVLTRRISEWLEPGWKVLDVGCGDGTIGHGISLLSPGTIVEGVEVGIRPQTAIPVRSFDGHSIPVDDDGVDAVLLVDVVHHASDPERLLREASRVARQAIVIKDHRLGRPFAAATLRFMDRVGNRGYDVALPFNYWSESRWRCAWSELELDLDRYSTQLGLYSRPARWFFESGLHFLARLTPRDPRAHYNLACSHALLGQPEEAIAALEQACGLGFRDSVLLRRDNELDSLREDPRFQAIERLVEND